MDANTLEKELAKASIIDEYTDVLGATSSVTYGAAESLLPHAKEEIKKAIKLIVLLLSELDPTAQTTIEKLKIAYRELASFIPDEDAKLLAKDLTLAIHRRLHH